MLENNWIPTKSCAHACFGALWGMCWGTIVCSLRFQAFKSLSICGLKWGWWGFGCIFWLYHNCAGWVMGSLRLQSCDYSLNCGPNSPDIKITFSHVQRLTPNMRFCIYLFCLVFFLNHIFHHCGEIHSTVQSYLAGVKNAVSKEYFQKCKC